MSPIGRNPRRAYQADGTEMRPVTFGEMVASVIDHIEVFCSANGCSHHAVVSVEGIANLQAFSKRRDSLQTRTGLRQSQRFGARGPW